MLQTGTNYTAVGNFFKKDYRCLLEDQFNVSQLFLIGVSLFQITTEIERIAYVTNKYYRGKFESIYLVYWGIFKEISRINTRNGSSRINTIELREQLFYLGRKLVEETIKKGMRSSKEDVSSFAKEAQIIEDCLRNKLYIDAKLRMSYLIFILNS